MCIKVNLLAKFVSMDFKSVSSPRTFFPRSACKVLSFCLTVSNSFLALLERHGSEETSDVARVRIKTKVNTYIAKKTFKGKYFNNSYIKKNVININHIYLLNILISDWILLTCLTLFRVNLT